jgi:hypothetical protein
VTVNREVDPSKLAAAKADAPEVGGNQPADEGERPAQADDAEVAA